MVIQNYDYTLTTFQILDKEENEEGGSGSDHTTHPEGENESSM